MKIFGIEIGGKKESVQVVEGNNYQAFSTPFLKVGEGNLSADQAKVMQEAFDSRHKGWAKAHKTAILSGGAKYKPTNVPNDQAQFLDSRRMAVANQDAIEQML